MALRRHLVTIVLAVAAVLLVVYLLVIDRGRATTGETSERTRNVFPVFRRAEISAIEIRQGPSGFRLIRREADGGAVYDLEREGAAREPADMTAVGKLIGDLELATRERRVDVRLRESGLEKPESEVALSMGRLAYRLRIGGPAPAPAGAAYAELEGEGVSVVRREIVAALERPWESYRTKMLVPYGVSGAERIDIAGEGAPRHLRREAGGELRVETEQGLVRVERGAAERIASALADLRVESFATGDLGDAGERIIVEMAPRDAANGPVRVEIGGVCPGATGQRRAVRYAPLPRIDACVAETAAAGLTAPVSALADLHLYSMRADEMEEVRLERGETRLELARKGTGWHMRFPRDETVDADTGNALARDLEELEAKEIAGSPSAFAANAKTTITRVEGGGEQTVEVGAANGDGTALVRRVADGAFLRVGADVVHALTPGVGRLRSLAVLDVPLGSVRRITVELGDVRQSLRRNRGGAWSLDEPKGLGVDTGIANDIAEAIGSLRAARWADDAGFAPRGKVVLERDAGDGGAALETLLVGAPATGGAFAKLERAPDVFVLASADERTIATWAIDRSATLLDPKGAREIRVRRGTETLTWRAPFDPKDERVAVVESSLDEMRAEAAVHTGPARREEGLERPAVDIWVDRGHVAIGAGDVWRGVNVYYARRDGVDATFVVARGKVKGLVEMR